MEGPGNQQFSADFEKEMIPVKVKQPKKISGTNPNKVWIAVSALLMLINMICLIIAAISFMIIKGESEGR